MIAWPSVVIEMHPGHVGDDLCSHNTPTRARTCLVTSSPIHGLHGLIVVSCPVHGLHDLIVVLDRFLWRTIVVVKIVAGYCARDPLRSQPAGLTAAWRVVVLWLV